MDGHTTRLIAQQNRASAPMLLREMYRDRKRVFVDMLKWDIPHEAGLERDRFDAGPAGHLIRHEARRGEHVASLRLLRTDLTHLMAETFSGLCVGGAPSGPHIRE